MYFTDIHNHSLYNTDDGAPDAEVMYKMVDASYADGVRYLCLTPHFHIGYYGDNVNQTELAYDQLCKYCADRYPDLTIARGNELHFGTDALRWLKNGSCHTLSDSNCILVDFDMTESEQTIYNALRSISAMGYTVILAHAERYVNLKIDQVSDLKADGIIIQINALSLLGGYGSFPQRRSKKLLSLRLVDLVSSDAHNLTNRPPTISSAYRYIKKKHGDEVARLLCFSNAAKLVFGTDTP